jgi:tetratricopeptide (TPR) repeat protein
LKRCRLVCRLHVIFAFIILPFVSLPSSILAQTVQCKVVPVATPTEAQNAFLHSDYEKAAALYQAQLQLLRNDAALAAEFSLVLLRQQKVQEASDLVHKALAQHPGSVDLLTALGEVQYREGTPWLAGPTIKDAMKVDPCYPRLRLLSAKLLRLSSYYGLAAKEIKIAHMLAPHDPEIRLVWLGTLPLGGRITELESYLVADNGEDAETKTHLHFYLDFLKHQLTEPHKSCRLVSDTETATVPFAAIRHDPTHIRAFGLDVKLNGYSARLQIDTGASGLIISRSVAEHAGLKQFSRNEIAGIGSQGHRQSYTAYADDIRISRVS